MNDNKQIEETGYYAKQVLRRLQNDSCEQTKESTKNIYIRGFFSQYKFTFL